jgi:predicted GIY-YIG superfamily endonuclease
MTRKAEDRIVVYAAILPAAGLIYVGATKNFGIRRSQHRRNLERGKHGP